MRTRFFYNSLLALTAGFLVVATQAFLPATVAWITFGIGVGITAVAAAMVPLRTGLIQRILSALAVALGAWTIVLGLVFAPTTVVWLGFASGIACVALAFTGLTAHELTTERSFIRSTSRSVSASRSWRKAQAIRRVGGVDACGRRPRRVQADWGRETNPALALRGGRRVWR